MNNGPAYKYLSNFITKERSSELAEKFIQYCAAASVPGDEQSLQSPSVHNFPLFVELLCEKVSEISAIIGEPVLPTYAYARVYRNGSVLTRHKDREACEISVTLNLKKDVDWPIFIESEGKEVSLELDPGSGMMYKGCEAEHWRNQYSGNEYVQVFLHYVRARGPNSFAAFDKVKTLDDFLHQKAITYNMVEEKIKEYNAKNLPAVLNKQTSDLTDDHINELKKYIIVVKGALSSSDCKLILKEYKTAPEWIQTGVGNGTPNPNIRNAMTINMSDPGIIQANTEVRKKIDQVVFERVSSLIRHYNQLYPHCVIVEDTGYELLRYEKGGFYTQHTDSFLNAPRIISCSLQLNNKFEGGEFAFFDGKLVYKLEKGDAILFPSSFMYPHEIKPVTSGTRYAIITWFR